MIRTAVALAVLISAAAIAQDAPSPRPSLVERLGFPKETVVLILNADDAGMNHASNVGVKQVLKNGAVTSATIMVPCPWFLEMAEFAREQPQANLGLHLTLTSEWGVYKWGPVLGRTAVPGLADEQGYFYPSIFGVYQHAKLDEVEKEIRAQIDKALAAGIDVTHVDSHMGTLQYNPRYHEVYTRVAADYKLPIRMAGEDLMPRAFGGKLYDQAEALGVLHPDRLYTDEPPTIEETESYWKAKMAGLEKGLVHEIYIHCGQLTPEMEATTGSWRRRTADTEFFAKPETREWIIAQGIELISYRELRHLQREGSPMPRVARYGGWE